MSVSFNSIPYFDGYNYGYWKSRMRFFLKAIDVWYIVEFGWATLDTTIAKWTTLQKQTRAANDKGMNVICSSLSPSEFSRISNCETAKEAWDILETIYEGAKLVKSAKLQMLVSEFERIRMLENETFNEFYDRISDLRNSIINLGNKVSDTKLIKKILRSLPEKFRIKVTTIKENKDLDNMKIEELIRSLLTYKLSLPLVNKAKFIALKASKGKSKNYSEEESDDEDGIAMFARNIRDLLISRLQKVKVKIILKKNLMMRMV
jgi:hypothetical protein